MCGAMCTAFPENKTNLIGLGWQGLKCDHLWQSTPASHTRLTATVEQGSDMLQKEHFRTNSARAHSLRAPFCFYWSYIKNVVVWTPQIANAPRLDPFDWGQAVNMSLHTTLGVNANPSIIEGGYGSSPSKRLLPTIHTREKPAKNPRLNFIRGKEEDVGRTLLSISQLRPKGVGEEGGRWKIEPGFFLPWQVREWYVPSPSWHHQIPNFLRTLHIF